MKKKTIKVGQIKAVGEVKIVTQSHKSKPGDGTHGAGVRGGGHVEFDCYF